MMNSASIIYREILIAKDYSISIQFKINPATPLSRSQIYLEYQNLKCNWSLDRIPCLQEYFQPIGSRETYMPKIYQQSKIFQFLKHLKIRNSSFSRIFYFTEILITPTFQMRQLCLFKWMLLQVLSTTIIISSNKTNSITLSCTENTNKDLIITLNTKPNKELNKISRV